MFRCTRTKTVKKVYKPQAEKSTPKKINDRLEKIEKRLEALENHIHIHKSIISDTTVYS